MRQRIVYWFRLVSTALIALTAIPGGIALVSGIEGARFPTSWLSGTPFHTYMVPGLILSLAVGGNAAIAFVLTIRRRKLARVWSALAGLCLAGFILVEIIILKQSPPGPTAMEIVYLALALPLALSGFARGGHNRD